ncbi:MAG: hypothetical protein NDI62_02845 [Burkholderiales bacterium]|nr:hypothetical protein [Burkholderiales bacterium]
MKTNKGYIKVSFILAIIVVLIITGGAYYLGTLKSVNDNVLKVENNVENNKNKGETKFGYFTDFLRKLIYEMTPSSNDPNQAKYFIADLNNDEWPEVAISSFLGDDGSSIPSFSVVSVSADKSFAEIAKTADLKVDYKYTKIGEKIVGEELDPIFSEKVPDFIGAVDITGDGIKEIFVDRNTGKSSLFDILIVDFEKHDLKWGGYQYSGKTFYEGDTTIKEGDKFMGLPPLNDSSERYVIFDIDGDRQKEILITKELYEKYSIKSVFKWDGNVLVSRPDLLKGIETAFGFWDFDKVLKGFLIRSSCDGWKDFTSDSTITCVLRDYTK